MVIGASHTTSDADDEISVQRVSMHFPDIVLTTACAPCANSISAAPDGVTANILSAQAGAAADARQTAIAIFTFTLFPLLPPGDAMATSGWKQ